jgi:eukaryotic-like serine/threonine-protein kinase
MRASVGRLPLRAGDVCARKYRIDRKIGEGGMGAVFAATHIELEQSVALKVLLPSLVEDEPFVTRFLREARAAVKIRGEHVARVYDVGKLDDELGTPFIVMDLLDGIDLAQRVLDGGPLSPSEAADVVIQACHALAQAHAIGIVHRDIKPANLFLAKNADGVQSVKVLDFGISKAPTGDVSVTTTDEVFGSPMYMSPEQLRGARDVRAPSDVWSLGVVLFELLTGETPFSESSPAAIAGAILHAAPKKLRAVRPDLPPRMEHVVDRCLQKSTEHRFASAADLAEALVPFASERGQKVASTIPSLTQSPSPAGLLQHADAAADSSAADAAVATTVRAMPRRSIARASQMAVAFVVLLLFGAAGFFVSVSTIRRKNVSPPPAAVASDTAPAVGSVPLVVTTDVPVTPPSAAADPSDSLATAATASPRFGRSSRPAARPPSGSSVSTTTSTTSTSTTSTSTTTTAAVPSPTPTSSRVVRDRHGGE